MKRISMRVGMSFELADEEIESILGDEFDAGMMAYIVHKAIKEGRFEADGVCRISAGEVAVFNSAHDTNYAMTDAECVL